MNTIDEKILLPDTQAHFESLQRSFDEMGIRYTPVTLHTGDGKLHAVRVSMTACIALATLHFVQPN